MQTPEGEQIAKKTKKLVGILNLLQNFRIALFNVSPIYYQQYVKINIHQEKYLKK